MKSLSIFFVILLITILCIIDGGPPVFAGPPRAGRPVYTIEISSDRAYYLEGMQAHFTVTVRRWKEEREVGFSMCGKYLAAWYPTKETEIILTRSGANTWEFEP